MAATGRPTTSDLAGEKCGLLITTVGIASAITISSTVVTIIAVLTTAFIFTCISTTTSIRIVVIRVC